MANKAQIPEKKLELDRPAYVVLGMVKLGAQSGYEIKKAVERSIRFFWTISEAQIYPSLERLERAGLIEGKSEPLGKRQRRTFTLTEAGEAALHEWLRTDEPLPFELRDIGLVKLFFADALEPGDALALLAALKQRSATRVAALRAIEPTRFSQTKGGAYSLLTLRMGIAFHRAIVEVCEDFEGEAAES